MSLRFSWKLKGEYAPLFVAREKGYFAEQGLDVGLNEGAGPTAAFASLIKGADQISWMPGLYSMQATSQGMPLKIIALYNDSAPLVIASWPEKPIRTPPDGDILARCVVARLATRRTLSTRPAHAFWPRNIELSEVLRGRDIQG